MIRVLVAEDDSRLRRALVGLLELDSEFDVVGDAADGQAALEVAGVVRPDVLLTDIEMPRKDGIQLTREFRGLLPESHVVILTKFGDDDRVFSAIKAGAVGYLLKDAGLAATVDAVRAASRGEGMLSPGLMSRVMREFTRLSASAVHNRKLFAELSRREVEVLECLVEGMRNSDIADRFSLSEKTVKSHVGAILKKLHVNDRAEAAIVAKEGGLL